MLIGGLGADKLDGGSSDDILIGGTTIYDDQLGLAGKILSEWKRTDLGYSTRVSHVTKGGGLNGTWALSPKTVFGTTQFHDSVTGGGGTDLFFKASGDVLTDKSSGETAVLI